MSTLSQSAQDYQLIEQLIAWLHEHQHEQPSLTRLGEVAGVSPHHLQRIFTRWAGISPKQFVSYLTAQHAKALLRSSQPILDVSFELGMSSPSRVHDLLLKVEAMTPGEYKNEGRGTAITFGDFASPFGRCVLAITARGVCALAFLNAEDDAQIYLHTQWPQASIQRDDAQVQPYFAAMFAPSKDSPSELTLVLRGTPFQLKVWEALLSIPQGCVTTYSALAERIDAPKAPRAVASAVARNAIAYLIPCHRVIQKLGYFGGYRWGEYRKPAMLAWEHAQQEVTTCT